MDRRITIAITIISFVAIIFWLEITIGLGQIYQTLLLTNPIFLLPTFGLLLVSYIIRTKRWNLILQAYKPKTEGFQLFPILSSGTWMNLVIPFKIAELVRPFWLRDKKYYSITQAISSILVERFFDFAILLLIPVAMSVFFIGGSFLEIQQTVTSSVLIFSALLIFLILTRSDRFIQLLTKIVAKTFSPSKRLRTEMPKFTEQLAFDIQQLLKNSRSVPLALLTSIPIWVLEAFKLVFIGLSLGYALPIETALFAGSLSYVAGHLLIIPSGIGIFFSQYLFLVLTVPGEIATAIALLDVLVYVLYLTVTGAPSILHLGSKSISLETEVSQASTSSTANPDQ